MPRLRTALVIPALFWSLMLAPADLAAQAIGASTLASLPSGGTTPIGLTRTGSEIIDRDRLDKTPQIPVAPAQAPPVASSPTGPAAPALDDGKLVTVNQVVIEGTASLSAGEIAATWQAVRGQTVPLREVYGISDRVAAALGAKGLALYSVDVPAQDFADGTVRIHVSEGFVGEVAIQGDTEGGDLGLLKAYAARIVAMRPLQQSTVERYILLMNDIAGLTVGSAFQPIPGQPGAVRLVLTISRKRFEAGVGVDNQGQASLSHTSLDANAAVNSLLREGDRTQVVFGAPLSIERYQYYGIVHREPIGTDGATLQANAGYLTITPGRTIVSGNAFTAGVRLAYPVIRALKESLVVSGAFDLLNSDNAVLSTILSDERTRALRASFTYALQDRSDAVTVISATGSLGLDTLGARRGSAASGKPGFSKLAGFVSREQPVPLGLIARLSLAGQLAAAHLPLSEQFSYGGLQFGRSFDTGAVRGDQGFAVSGELAHPLNISFLPAIVSGTEVFGFGDYGRVFNTRTPYQYKTDWGASAGFGARTKIREKLTFELTAARTLQKPREVNGRAGWRLVVAVRGTF